MPSPQPYEPPVAIADQIVVGFDHKKIVADGVDQARKAVESALGVLAGLGTTVLRSFVAESSNEQVFFAIAVIRIDDPDLTLAQLRNNKHPALANAFFERNVPITMAAVAPVWQRQWALDKLQASTPWTVAPPAGSRTIVSIVDSGLRRADGTIHEDLGSVALPADCQLPGFFPDNIDQDGHGTRLAGTIAAVPANGKGIDSAVPANWNISLLPVKFFSPAVPPNAADAAIAIAHAVDKGAKVINASWHVAPGDKFLRVLRLAILLARVWERLVVVAAGNEGTDNEIYPIYPANFGSDILFRKLAVLTVLASDRNDAKAPFSNYGKNIVDLAAPGQDIESTGLYLVGQPPAYPLYTGTSAAAAFASSGAALVFALNPNWRARDAIEHLTASADVVEGLKLACIGGKRLNLRRAVYGPLHVTAPLAGDTLHVGIETSITWTNEYDNPSFNKVKIEFSMDDGATYGVLAASVNNDGLRKWKPAAGHATSKGRIRITPTQGNFPVVSGQFKVI